MGKNKVNNFSLMLREIYNVKFSNIFFSMIHSLINEEAIYKQALMSLTKYLGFYNLKNIQQEKILDIINVLLEHIKN
jgi:hypothetical protein